MVTIKEIARECGVSVTTVSNVLNGKAKVGEAKRQKILDVIQKRGYHPNSIAQGLRMQKTRTISIIAEDISQFSTPPIVESVMSYFEEKGYRTIVKNLRLYSRWNDAWFSDEDAYHSVLDPILTELDSIMVDGILYIAGHARIIDCFPESFRIPSVMAYAYSQNRQVPSIMINDELSAYQLIRYVIGQGHRQIGMIGGRIDNIHTQRRLAGYQKALYEAGIPFNPAWVRYGDWEKESGYLEAEPLLKTGVTAIFCCCDRTAGGLYLYLDEHGQRPGRDLAVVGFDNQDIAEYLTPGLTTMALPLHEIGHISAQLLLKQIEGDADCLEEAGKEILIPCEFMERSSVFPLKTDGPTDTTAQALT